MAPKSAGPRGFTLVELLTVMAILGILATLLLSTLGSAQKASQRARCISNLRQISVGLHLYLDDFEKRPGRLTDLRASGHLPNREVFLCPADKYGGWGGRVQSGGGGLPEDAELKFAVGDGGQAPPPGAPTEPVRLSYLHPLDWDEDSWQQLSKKGTQAGIAACQLHGLGRPDPEFPSIRDFQGLVFRAQWDGAVVKRQVFWDQAAADPPSFNRTDTVAPAVSVTVSPDHPWQLFSDDPIPSVP
jgi:prepilin-type N-terminal cleavage/methylation domain-containing protein